MADQILQEKNPHTCFDRLQLFAKWYIIYLVYLMQQRILLWDRKGLQILFSFVVALAVPKSMTIPCGRSVLVLMECELWITFRLQMQQKNGGSLGVVFKLFARRIGYQG